MYILFEFRAEETPGGVVYVRISPNRKAEIFENGMKVKRGLERLEKKWRRANRFVVLLEGGEELPDLLD